MGDMIQALRHMQSQIMSNMSPANHHLINIPPPGMLLPPLMDP